MGWKLIALIPVLIAIGIACIFLVPPTLEPVNNEPQWWGPGEKKADDVTIKPMTIKIPDADIKDLKRRLEAARFGSDLEDGNFEYGFQTEYMKAVRDHWLKKFDWRKQEAILNQFSHFTTQIEGINVHFMRVMPKKRVSTTRRRVLLLTHGWPGSVWEFVKVLPLLTDPPNPEDAFEVICPSIPGFGFSEAPKKRGCGVPDVARIFLELMRRLGHNQFYAQGGDYGSLISTAMSQLYPEHILGLHLNMQTPSPTLPANLHAAAALLLPSVFLDDEDRKQTHSLMEIVTILAQETGYMHIQATKPDTVALGLNDSPIGLAGYILEKFSTATNINYRQLRDGGLTKKFTLDDLLTDVSIYWFTGTIGSSVRLYKELWKDEEFSKLDRYPVNVPCGIAHFPNEFQILPRTLAGHRYKRLIQYTDMPAGGHFAAMEEPKLFADDVFSFVYKVEQLEKIEK